MVTAPLPEMAVHPAQVVAWIGLTLSIDLAAIGMISCMRSLVERIPDDGIRRRMTIVMWVYGAASVPSYLRGVYLIWTTGLYGQVPSHAPFGLAIGILNGCFAVSVKFALLIWLLGLIGRIHQAFSRALREVK